MLGLVLEVLSMFMPPHRPVPIPVRAPELRCDDCGPGCDWHLHPCQVAVTEKKHCGCPGTLDTVSSTG